MSPRRLVVGQQTVNLPYAGSNPAVDAINPFDFSFLFLPASMHLCVTIKAQKNALI